MSPDGRTIAFSNQGTLSGHENIFTIDRDGGHLRQLTDDAARNRGPTWTPDGARIAFYSNRRGHYEVWSMNPDGGDLRPLASAPNGDDWLFPRFAGDGRLSIVGTKASALLDATVTPAKLTETLPPVETSGQIFWPYLWSPDRSTIAGFAASNTQGLLQDVILYRPASHTYERIAGAGLPVDWLPDGKRLFVAADRYYVLDLATRGRTPVGPWSAAGFAMFGATLADGGRTFYYTSLTPDANIWMMTFDEKP